MHLKLINIIFTIFSIQVVITEKRYKINRTLSVKVNHSVEEEKSSTFLDNLVGPLFESHHFILFKHHVCNVQCLSALTFLQFVNGAQKASVLNTSPLEKSGFQAIIAMIPNLSQLT